MLTFEKVLKVFQAYLEDDPLYEVVQTSHCLLYTSRHFPDMMHLGDITKVDGGKIPPVHVITFGSPCQNLSLIEMCIRDRADVELVSNADSEKPSGAAENRNTG